MDTVINEQFLPVTGVERTFNLNGHALVIPANMDKHNGYRLKFRSLAKACADKAKTEYIESIHNFDTFMEFFPRIYNDNLDVVVTKAIDILIGEGIYTVTSDMLKKIQVETFHMAIDDYANMEESVKLTIQQNKSINSSVFGIFGSMIGRKSEAVGGLFESFTDGVVDGISELNAEQKNELYQRIVPHILFQKVLVDYRSVYITLVHTMQRAGIDVWYPTDETSNELENIFRNLSNPNFPADKINEILFSVVNKQPYRQEIYTFMKAKFGETEEVCEITSYFGFADENDYTYVEDDFPKPEISMQLAGETNQNLAKTNDPDTDQDKKQKSSFLKNGLKIGAGVLAVGALLGGLGNKNNEKETKKKDLLGSSSCILGKKDQSGFTNSSCMACPVRNLCTRG